MGGEGLFCPSPQLGRFPKSVQANAFLSRTRAGLSPAQTTFSHLELCVWGKPWVRSDGTHAAACPVHAPRLSRWPEAALWGGGCLSVPCFSYLPPVGDHDTRLPLRRPRNSGKHQQLCVAKCNTCLAHGVAVRVALIGAHRALGRGPAPSDGHRTSSRCGQRPSPSGFILQPPSPALLLLRPDVRRITQSCFRCFCCDSDWVAVTG